MKTLEMNTKRIENELENVIPLFWVLIFIRIYWKFRYNE